jgi:hypothetical protein
MKVQICWGSVALQELVSYLELYLFRLLLETLAVTSVLVDAGDGGEILQTPGGVVSPGRGQQLHHGLVGHLVGGRIRGQPGLELYGAQMIGRLDEEVQVRVVIVTNEVEVVADVVARDDVGHLVFHAAPPCVQVLRQTNKLYV